MRTFYTAELVTTRGGEQHWKSTKRYPTDKKAAAAIIAKAKREKMRVTGYQRWWYSHGSAIVDFGSYSFYGRIDKWREGKRLDIETNRVLDMV